MARSVRRAARKLERPVRVLMGAYGVGDVLGNILASARIPVLAVCGDADDVVPWEENTGLVASRYEALGGPITLIRKPGVGHHPHGLDDSTPIVEFIVKSVADH